METQIFDFSLFEYIALEIFLGKYNFGALKILFTCKKDWMRGEK